MLLLILSLVACNKDPRPSGDENNTTEHTHVEVIAPAVSATATTAGLNSGTKCSVCGEIIQEQKSTTVGLKLELVDTEDSYRVVGISNNVTTAEIVIPELYNDLPVTSIGDVAFQEYSNLIGVTIPSSITSIGTRAFYACYDLKDVYISDIAAWCNISFLSKSTSISANPLCYANNLYLNGKLTTDLVIPDGVTSIVDYAFWGFSGLTSVTIPDSVTSIGEYAFYHCANLTDVTMGNGVKSIDGGAFASCGTLKAVYISDIAAWCSISFSDPAANPAFLANNLYLNGQLITDLVIPDGVTSIGYSAFHSCYSLKSVTIPDSVTSIGESSFHLCTGLTDITIGNGVKDINDSAFSSCSDVTSVTIPNSVISIGDYVFYAWYHLTDIIYEGTIEEWRSIEKKTKWDFNTNDYIIHCTDGKLDIYGRVIAE